MQTKTWINFLSSRFDSTRLHWLSFTTHPTSHHSRTHKRERETIEAPARHARHRLNRKTAVYTVEIFGMFACINIRMTKLATFCWPLAGQFYMAFAVSQHNIIITLVKLIFGIGGKAHCVVDGVACGTNTVGGRWQSTVVSPSRTACWTGKKTNTQQTVACVDCGTHR